MSARILIVDDHEAVRRGVRGLLSSRSDWLVCGEAADGIDAVEKVRELRPDVVLMDISMPRMGGIEATQIIRQDSPEARVIIVSQNDPAVMSRQAREIDAHGCVAKADLAKELIPSIRKALDERPLPEGKHFRNGSARKPPAPRKAQSRASADKEIAERLQIALAASHTGTFRWNPRTGVYLAFDDNLKRLFGKAPETPFNITEDFLKLVHPDDLPALATAVDECHRGADFSMDYRVVLEDGSVRWLHDEATMERDSSGNPTYLVGACTDITERKRNETLLREQEKLVELIARGAPLDECLAALTGAVARLRHGARAGVMMADDKRMKISRTVAPEIVDSFGSEMKGAPICDLAICTCATAIYTGRPVTCADTASDDIWSREWRDLCVAHGILAIYSTPVFAAGGMANATFFISFDRPCEPGPWEREIAQLGAHVTGIALERDRTERLLHERESTLQDDLAALGQLQGLSSELIREANVQSLYKKIVDAAVDIMGADYGSMQKLSSGPGGAGRLHLLAYRGFTPEAAKFWEIVDIRSGSSCGEALRVRGRVIVSDVERCDFIAGTGDLETYLQTGIRAVQTTPLFARNGEILGMISTHWREAHDPSQRDLRLLDVLARQAADLIERGHAEEALRDREERFRAVFEQAACGVAQSDLTGHFNLVNNRFCEIVGRSREELMSLSMQSITHPEDLPFNVGSFSALSEGRGPDFVIEKRYLRPDGTEVWVRNQVSAVRDASGAVRDVLAIVTDISDRKRAEERYRGLAESLEAQVAERTRELECRNADVMRQSEELRELSVRLMRSQDEERRRIARDLHDSAGQIVAALGMMLAGIEDKTRNTNPETAGIAAKCQLLIEQLTREVRSTSYLLHPPMLDESGLGAALRTYARGVAERTGLSIDVAVSGDFGRLPREAELAVFRAIQEALTNIHRHSGSKIARISFSRQSGRACIEIEDEGRGIPSEKFDGAQLKGFGVGIAGMRERISHIGGDLTIHSASGRGVKVTLSIPLREEETATMSSRAVGIL